MNFDSSHNRLDLTNKRYTATEFQANGWGNPVEEQQQTKGVFSKLKDLVSTFSSFIPKLNKEVKWLDTKVEEMLAEQNQALETASAADIQEFRNKCQTMMANLNTHETIIRKFANEHAPFGENTFILSNHEAQIKALVEQMKKLENQTFKEHVNNQVKVLCDLIPKVGGGCATEGLFRVSGTRPIIEQKSKAIKQGKSAHFEDVQDIHTLVGILKRLVRTEPSRIPERAYRSLMASFQKNPPSNDEAREALIDEAKEALAPLPQKEKEVLQALFSLLEQINANSETSKMNYRNLATILAPPLLPEAPLEEINAQISLLALVLENHADILPRGVVA